MRLTSLQKKIVLASFLGWSLDAFDFFLLVFVLSAIAQDFNTSIEKIAISITLTLAMRPLGALLWGFLADRYGRRPVLMVDIALFALFEFLTAFSTGLTSFLILRVLFGIAMGGEWGIASALTMESIPREARGFVSGILQAGYPAGYLLASLVFGLCYSYIGWRGLFIIGGLPALLVFYIREHIPESAAWQKIHAQKNPAWLPTLNQHWKLFLYAILLMTGFNFFSHGSQDLYPTFLEVQHKLDAHTVSFIAIIYNIGAILGGLALGALSQHIGRRMVILLAALLTLPILPFWAYSQTVLAFTLTSFIMQFAIQGAWGVVPAYLNEISPAYIRATFPGVVYQLGNLLASINAVLQAYLAVQYGNNFSIAFLMVVGITACFLVVMALIGPEKRELEMM